MQSRRFQFTLKEALVYTLTLSAIYCLTLYRAKLPWLSGPLLMADFQWPEATRGAFFVLGWAFAIVLMVLMPLGIVRRSKPALICSTVAVGLWICSYLFIWYVIEHHTG